MAKYRTDITFREWAGDVASQARKIVGEEGEDYVTNYDQEKLADLHRQCYTTIYVAHKIVYDKGE